MLAHMKTTPNTRKIIAKHECAYDNTRAHMHIMRNTRKTRVHTIKFIAQTCQPRANTQNARVLIHNTCAHIKNTGRVEVT